jgi:hypothetical protein
MIEYYHTTARKMTDALFVTTPEQLVDEIVKAVKELRQGYGGEFTRVMVEIINEIREPMQEALRGTDVDDPVSQA